MPPVAGPRCRGPEVSRIRGAFTPCTTQWPAHQRDGLQHHQPSETTADMSSDACRAAGELGLGKGPIEERVKITYEGRHRALDTMQKRGEDAGSVATGVLEGSLPVPPQKGGLF